MESFENTLIKPLEGSDFENDQPWKLKNENRCSFVLFYADWCGHCQNFKPEYIKFADIAQFLHVYAVNEDQQATLVDKINESSCPFKINGFPSLWIFKNGVPIEKYVGPRTVESLIEKGKEICSEKCTCDKAINI